MVKDMVAALGLGLALTITGTLGKDGPVEKHHFIILFMQVLCQLICMSSISAYSPCTCYMCIENVLALQEVM